MLLARNHPSYQLGIVPADLPNNDPDPLDIDEEFEAIMDILVASEVHARRDLNLEIQRTMFRSLGYRDYLQVLNNLEIPVIFVEVPVDALAEEGVESDTPPLPDIRQPIPIEGLAGLIQARVQQERQGNASNPIPILFNVDRDAIFIMAEQGYRLPGLRVLEGGRARICVRRIGQPYSGVSGPDSRGPDRGLCQRGIQRPE